MTKETNRLGETFLEWEILQEDMCVTACNNREELQHYVWQYLEDGDLEVWEVRRTLTQIFKKPRGVKEK